jgi:hypothetical protein
MNRKIVFWIILMIITAMNIFSAVINKNFSAIFGWSASECWLLLLLIEEIEKKQSE